MVLNSPKGFWRSLPEISLFCNPNHLKTWLPIQSVPFSFASARLNALQAAVRHPHSKIRSRIPFQWRLYPQVDCCFSFWGSSTSCSCSASRFIHYSQVDWRIDFWGSTIQFKSLSTRQFRQFPVDCLYHFCQTGLQVDCYLFQNTLSLQRQIRNILWGRMETA